MASATTDRPTLSRDLQREVINTALTERERNLLRLSSRQSLFSIAKLYREYVDEDGVQAALDAIREKMEKAAGRRAERAARGERRIPGRELTEAAGIDPESEEAETVTKPERVTAQMPVLRSSSVGTSGSKGKMPDAGAAREPARESATPPNDAAPASGPSASASTAVDATPPKLTERERTMVALLHTRRRSAKAMIVILGVNQSVGKTAVAKLGQKGVIERTEQNAYDWPGATHHGRPSRVWKLVDEPEGVEMVDADLLAADSVPGTRKSSGGGASEPVPEPAAAETELPATPAPARDEPVPEFDARKLWDGLSLEQREDMLTVAMESVSLADAISAACRSATKRATS